MDELNTGAFYKYESDSLLVGKKVLNLDYELHAENYAEYNLPVDGWHWFDTKDEAHAFFGLELIQEDNNELGKEI
jgi:hypothetical protein